MTLLGVFFLFTSDEKRWLPLLAFVLAIVNVIAVIFETRKIKAKAAQKEAIRHSRRSLRQLRAVRFSSPTQAALAALR